MPKQDRRVDAYIAKSAEFAKPILQHLRQLVQTGCPEVGETIKWRFPTFMYRGMLCSMAAFKQHCTFGFWKYALVLDPDLAPSGEAKQAMGQLGRITSLTDLPTDEVLIEYIRVAVRLNEDGVKKPSQSRQGDRRPVAAPPDLEAALRRNKQASKTFSKFSPGHKREYVEWITEAKRAETRKRRLETAVAWLAEGKARNWKYTNC